MHRLVSLALAAGLTSAALVSVAPSPAGAGEGCTPSLTMHPTFADGSGWTILGADFTVCEPTNVTFKVRDRDGAPGWGKGGGTRLPGSGVTYSGACYPDGQSHRLVAYATLKIKGEVLFKTPKIYFKPAPVTGCGAFVPPGA